MLRRLSPRWSMPFTLVVLLLAACSGSGDEAADTTLASTTTETTTTIAPTTTTTEAPSTTAASTTTTVAMSAAVVGVSFDGETCDVDTESVPAGDHAFVVTNDSDETVHLYVSILGDGHTFDELLELQEEVGVRPTTTRDQIGSSTRTSASTQTPDQRLSSQTISPCKSARSLRAPTPCTWAQASPTGCGSAHHSL